MIKKRWTIKNQLESTIGCMGHVGFVIPWVYHFLSRLRSLLARAWNRRAISIKKVHKWPQVNADNSEQSKRRNWHELTGVQVAQLHLLFRFLPSRPQRIQRPRKRVAFQVARRFAISCVKQPTWIPSSNHNPLDWHHQRMAHPGRLRPIHDWQHDHRRVDAKVQLRQARQQSNSCDNSSRCSKEICVNFYASGC